MTKLKPCQFCGNTAVDVERKLSIITNYYVVCNFHDGGCGAAGEVRRTRKEAIEAWNRRASENDTKKE